MLYSSTSLRIRKVCVSLGTTSNRWPKQPTPPASPGPLHLDPRPLQAGLLRLRPLSVGRNAIASLSAEKIWHSIFFRSKANSKIISRRLLLRRRASPRGCRDGWTGTHAHHLCGKHEWAQCRFSRSLLWPTSRRTRSRSYQVRPSALNLDQ